MAYLAKTFDASLSQTLAFFSARTFMLHVGRRHASTLKNASSIRPNMSKAPARQPPPAKEIFQAKSMIRKKMIPGTRQPSSLEKSMSSVIQTIKSARVPSVESMAAAASFQDLENEDGSSERLFEVGTYVEVRQFDSSLQGVVLGDVIWYDTPAKAVLAASGEITYVLERYVVYSVPYFVSAELAARSGLSFPAMTQIQLAARVEILQRMRKLIKETEEALHGLTGRQIDFYAKLKSNDPTKCAHVSLSEITSIWVNKPSAVTNAATLHYLFAHSEYFEPSPDFASTSIFVVKSQAEVDQVQRFKDWVKADSEVIKEFVKRAKVIVKENQEGMRSTIQEPAHILPPTHHWTNEDRVILEVMISTLRPPNDQWRRLIPLVSPITKELGYTETTSLYECLVDLGVFPPWKDFLSLQHINSHILDRTRVQQMAAIAERSRQKLLSPSSHKPPQQILGPEDLYSSDPLESQRQDWGNMPVFAVDDVDAYELDDGLSIEPVPGDEGKYWVYIHIADPASLLPPTHLLSQQAMKIGETIYLQDEMYPLLPSNLTTGPNGFSLEHGQTRNVLTFCAKVDTDGNIFESRIQPGIARNIITLDYESVTAALGLPMQLPSYPFGDNPPPPPLQKIEGDILTAFKLMDKVSAGFVRKRFDDGVLMSVQSKAVVENVILPSPLPEDWIQAPGRYRGTLGMRYTVTSMLDQAYGGRSIVAEMMKLAARIASRFCLERDIPALRRFSLQDSVRDPDDWYKLLKMRDERSFVAYEDSFKYIGQKAMAGYTLEPMAHFQLGVASGEGYTRATSPLRRYADLLLHHQIHASLLGKPLPWDKGRLAQYMTLLQTQESNRRRLLGRSVGFWNARYVRDWIAGKRATSDVDPVKNVEALMLASPILSDQRMSVKIWVPSIGIKGILSLSRDEAASIIPGTMRRVELVTIRMDQSCAWYFKLSSS